MGTSLILGFVFWGPYIWVFLLFCGSVVGVLSYKGAVLDWRPKKGP